jgi:hypothetical protein
MCPPSPYCPRAGNMMAVATMMTFLFTLHLISFLAVGLIPFTMIMISLKWIVRIIPIFTILHPHHATLPTKTAAVG